MTSVSTLNQAESVASARLDVGSGVRQGEELNLAAVDAYLKGVDPTLSARRA
jgi:hypothetical protein